MAKNETLKQKRLKAAAIVLGIAALLISCALGFFLRGAIVGKDAAALSEIAAYLKAFGVFDSSTAEIREFTAEDAARLIVKNVPDDYAAYYTKEDYKAIKENYSGKYEGVGISVYTGTLKVAKVIGNSPAFKAGIEREDVLVSGRDSFGNVSVFADIASVNEFLSSITDSEFSLTVLRDGEEKTLQMRIEKYNSSYLLYKDKDSAYAYTGDYDSELKLVRTGEGISELPENAAYIRFDSFEGGAAKELKGILALMKNSGKTRLILDLRGNGGGYMNVLCDFVGGVIYNEGKSGFSVACSKDNKGEFTEYRSSRNFYEQSVERIAVIADEYSASATECLIGAMLHYGGAFSQDYLVIENESLVGGVARTYGKGIMQTTFDLSNGGAIKITTAVIYRPDKITCIHGKGITVSGDNAVIKSENKAISRAISLIA